MKLIQTAKMVGVGLTYSKKGPAVHGRYNYTLVEFAFADHQNECRTDHT